MKVKDFARILRPELTVKLYCTDETFSYLVEYAAGALDACAYSDDDVDFYHFGTEGIALWLKGVTQC